VSDQASLHRRLEEDLRAVLGAPAGAPLARDDGGDLTFSWGSARVRVRLLEHEPPLVAVIATVLDGVERTPELLGVLNDMNAGIVSARVFWADGAVLAVTEIPAGPAEREELEHALWAVGSFADWADNELQPRFGGFTGGE